MKKTFEYRGIVASIKVVLNYQIERRVGGENKHKVSVACLDINYINEHLVSDKVLVQSIINIQNELEKLIDIFLEPKKEDLDIRLVALGFK